jgi:hypothetical protein
LGAVLLLRYFDLRNPGKFKPADLAQMRAAAFYYAEEMMARGGASPLLDQLYLVGLYPEVVIPAEQAGGGKGQVNPALLPELIAGLGAVRFLRRPAHGRPARNGAHEAAHNVFICGRDKPDAITWNDLPLDGIALPDGDARDLLLSFARFSLAYACALHCAEKLSDVPHIEDLPAYYRFLHIGTVREGRYDTAAAELVHLCRTFLEWFGACNLLAASNVKFELATVDELVIAPEEALADAPKVILSCAPSEITSGKAAALQQLRNAYLGLSRRRPLPSLGRVPARMLQRPAAKRPSFTSFIDALYGSAADENLPSKGRQ